ncbi:hypothetical protein A6R68_01726, partial [Neotoma lepida]
LKNLSLEELQMRLKALDPMMEREIEELHQRFHFAAMIAIAAARVDEELIDTPVLDLLAEGEDAQLSHDVKLAGVVEM